MVDVVYDGPRSYLRFQGIKFRRGVPVQINDYAALGRLQLFRDFRISRDVVKPPCRPRGRPRKAHDGHQG